MTDNRKEATTSMDAPAKPRRTKRVLILSAVAVVAVAAVSGVVVLVQPPKNASAEPKPVAVQTMQIARGDLVQQVRAQGTLSYSSAHDLGTSLGGTVTGIPASGTVVSTGHELFRVDDSPIVLMHGSLPVWRAFSEGMSDGADVLQLEQNLVTLGFFDREPDTEFGWGTADAIERWQKSLGLEQTGMIELGRIIFSSSDVRIQSAKASIGDQASSAVISVTGVTKQVEAFLDTANQSLVPVGETVTVSLPGGATTTGTVVGVGGPVEKEANSGKSLKIPVTLTLDDPEAVASFDNVSVSVILTTTKDSDVLLLPVSALLAQPGGGFAVEVTDGKKTPRLVTVELGAFADGFVAVTGGDLADGDTVVVAK